MIWTDPTAPESFEYLCAGPRWAGDRYHGERVRLRYAATTLPGIAVARCQHCRIAWVRATGRRNGPIHSRR